MSKTISLIIMGLVVIGIVGFLYFNVSEYYCDAAEEKVQGKNYKVETCCRFFGFSCYTEKTPIEE